MECPVCGNKDITPFATQCSSCGTDVVAFPMLDDLEEQCVITLKENVALEGELTALQQLRKEDKKRHQKRMNRMLWFLLLFPLMFFWCGRKAIPNTKVIELEKANATLTEQVDRLEKEKLEIMNNLSQEQEVKKDEDEIPDSVVHVVKRGDSLSKLAYQYFGDYSKWKQIHELNPQITNSRLLRPGDTLVIQLKK